MEDQPLGFSLTKTKGGFAEVSRVTAGGEAEKLDVLVGSYVVGLNDVKTSVFDEIVELVRTLPRPVLFQFVFRPGSIDTSPTATRAPAPTICSVPEPVSIHQEITFNERELGCSLQARDFVCVVQHVEKGTRPSQGD